MRVMWCGSLSLCLVLAAVAPARADEQAEMQAVIGKALKALGDEAKLSKHNAVTWKAKGIASIEGKDIDLKAEGAGQGLDRCRLDMEAVIDNRTLKLILVIDGDKGWLSGNGQVQDAPKEILAFLKTEMYVIRLAQGLTPLQDPSFKLSPLGEVKVQDRLAVGVKAVSKDRPEVNFWFDKETGLLLKCDFQVQEPEGQNASHEYLFGDYKDHNGFKHFSRLTLTRDGKKTFELELTDVKREEKLDDSVFGKP